MRIVDTLVEQEILEQEIEAVKPNLPPGTENLNPLLRTPFRYRPYPSGSRFRRADQEQGVFYASEAIHTAVAEMAFYRLLFLAESPQTLIPDRPVEFTAFSISYSATCLDLTAPEFDDQRDQLTHPFDYRLCQDLADQVRAADIDAIRYRSIRDPKQGMNIALLHWRTFTHPAPLAWQTWHLTLRPERVIAHCEFPRGRMEFSRDQFGHDQRLST